MITTGNFQDLVQLSQDTLYHLGPDFEVGNSASASTVSHGFQNTAGDLVLAAAATGNATVWLPVAGGTLLTGVNVSAGTTSQNLSAVTFSNANNVSFGLNGSVVTASINVSAANVGFSAGTTSNELSAITFSNSNGVSFGLNGSTMTGSIATSLTNINASAGTTSNNLSAIVFSNSNGVSFGLNGSTVTASAAASLNVSAGTTSNNLTNVVFSNSNNVSFGLNGSTVTASATVASSQGSVNFSGGTTSNNLSAIVFSNSNGVSFGLNGSTMTGSVATSLTAIRVSAGTTSNLLSAVTFSNSNGIAFGLNGSVVTAALGSMSSWAVRGGAATALSMGSKSLFFEAIVVPYNITVTNLLWLASVSNSTSNVSGGMSVSAALYTLNGGTTGSLSLASSGSTSLTWTSGAALSSNTGINYQSMTVASWALTPGPYLLAFWYSGLNSASMSIYGPNPQPVIGSGQGAAMSTVMLNGVSQATTGALPSSFGITNTASYIRTGATAALQPYIILQGT